tara:strand:- start:480 stop:1181 length:702 start_codon:yes stop_codon:yes gene_type:complete
MFGVNIDSVYQTVQALANKEQRGYITPQEFNLFANQAQMDIFEQYIYDLGAHTAQAEDMHVMGDAIALLYNKLEPWLTYPVVTGGTNLPNGGRNGRIFVNKGGVRRTLRKGTQDEIRNLRGSRWHKAGFDEVIYFEDGHNRIQVHTGAGQITSGVTCERIMGKPDLAYWGYIIVNEKPMHNPSASADFQIHSNDQTDLVTKILKLAGISTEDDQLYGMAESEDAASTQQENKH